MKPSKIRRRKYILVMSSALIVCFAASVYFKCSSNGYDYYSEADPEELQVIQTYDEGSPSGGKSVLLQKDAAEAYLAMHEAALHAGIELIPLSGFRTHDEQQVLFANKVQQIGKEQALRKVAPAGYSEHHTGYALDFATHTGGDYSIDKKFLKSKQYKWLKRFAAQYGFVLSSPDKNDPRFEPWHWRFQGTARAYNLFHRSTLAKMLDTLP